MPGRKYTGGTGYRYGFNGKENDNEVKGDGNQQDYGLRIYDPRLGKFLSVDLLTRKYPMLSTFQYSSNRPIDGIDLDGLEFLPYRKSMYQLQYSTTTSTYTLGSGKQQTVTTENVVVNTVYANIPAALQDAKTNSFKYVSGGPVTAWGRDWDVNKDGEIAYETSKYHNNGPEFNGLPPGSSPRATDATKPVGSYYGQDVMGGSSGLAKVGVAAAAIKEGYQIGENLSNTDVWNASGREQELRRGFYDATNTVDYYRKNNLIGEKSLLNASGRTALINFLTDGTLNTDVADNLKDELHDNLHYDYSPMRKNMYGNALQVAYTGLQMMESQGIIIRTATISAVQSTLQKYKANGGGTEYDDLNKYINPKK